MKNSILIIIIFFAQTVFGQDWQPFKMNANNFYFTDDESVFNRNQDSVSISGDTTTYYFNTQYMDESMEACFEALSENYPDYLAINMCHIIGDTMIFKSVWVPGFETKFINPDVLGFSWEITNPYLISDWNVVTIVYDSIGVETVFGSVDSVKYFSVNVDDVLLDLNTIDKIVIKLSKNHGFIEFLDWFEYAYPDSGYYDSMKLLGYASAADSVGFYIPKWTDYFNYQPGDVCIWEGMNSGHPDVYTKIKYVTSVIEADEYIEVSYSESTDLFYKDALQLLLEGPLVKTNYAPVAFDSEDIFYEYGKYSVGNIYYFLDLTCPLPALERNIGANRVQQIDDCYYFGELMGGGYYYSFHTQHGLSKFGYGTYDYYEDNYLVGGIMDGVAWGDISALGITSGSKSINQLTSYPNPTNDMLYFGDVDGDYRLINLHGNVIQSGTLFKTFNTQGVGLDVSALQPGFYKLIIQNNQGLYSSEFVKM